MSTEQALSGANPQDDKGKRAKLECVVCAKHAPYKCPTCRQPYCSIDCSQIHKREPCQAPVAVSGPILPAVPPLRPQRSHNSKPDSDTEDTEADRVPEDRLHALDGDTHVQQILRNPQVRQLIREIDSSDNPLLAMNAAMELPIFVEFVDACMRVCGPVEAVASN